MLIVAAYLGGTTVVAAPIATAAAGDIVGQMTAQAGDDGKTMPMPCHTKMQAGCVTEVGCVFMVSLPAPYAGFAAQVSWSAVTFVATAEFLHGHSIKPLLGPPISRT